MKIATVLTILWAFATAACGEQKAAQAVDAGRDTSPARDTLPDASKPRSDLPRPVEWALGTWVGTVPAEVSPGVSSRLSGKMVRVEITGVGREFEVSDIRGCFYVGSLTWEVGTPDESTLPLDELTSTNASWTYYPKQGIEDFSVNGDWGVGNNVALRTQDLGSPGTSPTELLVDWNIESSSIKEDTGGNPATRMRLKKQ